MFLVSGLKKNVAGRLAAYSLTMLCMLAFTISPARADSTFLLQLGTFNTEAQATQKWDEVKAKNADVLGKLTLHVAEVALPPDNAISYRTQAGPITSHDQAANLCSTLQTRDIECYVVETALFTGEQPPVATAENAPAAPAPTTPPVIETPPEAPVTAEAPIAAAPAPTAAPVPLPGVETPPPPTLPPVAVSPGGSAVAQAQAIASGTAPAAAPPAPPPSSGSIFSILPWNSQQATPPAPPPAPPAAVPPALPPGSMIPGREPHLLGAPPAPPPAPETFVPPPGSIAPPPPPAPAERPGFFGRLFGSSRPRPASADSNAVGEVSVAEAIRVPLGSGAQHKKNAIPGLPAVHGLGGSPSQSDGMKAYWAQLSYFTDEDQARNFYEGFRNAYPQFSDGTRVRITRPYANRAGHVSLRVGPFAGTNDVSTICAAGAAQGLRCTVVRDMGSSEIGSAVRTRHTLSSPEYAPQAAPRSIGASMEHESRPVAASTGMYWAQIGSYRSSDDALDTWKDLQDDNKKLLGRVRATVASPAMSSAARQLYRLRAGPFVSEVKANAICEGLQSSGTSCLVVHDH